MTDCVALFRRVLLPCVFSMLEPLVEEDVAAEGARCALGAPSVP